MIKMTSKDEKSNCKEIKVEEADAVEIISLVDNSVDFASTVNKQQVQSFRRWTRERYGQEWTKTHTQLPIAEHGFSMVIRVFNGEKSSCVLFDTGGSPRGIVENVERMGLSLSEVECIILSHGHYDHCGGLVSAVKAVNKVNLPVIVHENMFETRGTANPNGTVRKYPDFPSEAQLSPAQIVETKQPCLTANNMICVTGEIPRKTSFEKGYTSHRILADGSWQPDPWIRDERAIAINIKEKGLIVVSGCAHAGIINTISYAQQITETDKVYAVMGGFHLSGREFENRIEPTIKELQRINPKLIVPSHCTGWRAMCAIAGTLPEAFVWNSVGYLYRF
jgi:7,8-dihydropterin-6-yl-methyl-4-(beta-D-ribofuranosyl)aminobenzene 5'-phosphate synthase